MDRSRDLSVAESELLVSLLIAISKETGLSFRFECFHPPPGCGVDVVGVRFIGGDGSFRPVLITVSPVVKLDPPASSDGTITLTFGMVGGTGTGLFRVGDSSC